MAASQRDRAGAADPNALEVSFVNNRQDEVQLFFVKEGHDGETSETAVGGVLAPGEVGKHNSFAGHKFVARQAIESGGKLKWQKAISGLLCGRFAVQSGIITYSITDEQHSEL